MAPTADALPVAADRLEPTERTTVRRSAARGRYERSVVEAILDEAYLAHVGFVVDGQPRVLPMAYGRVDDVLYLHGAVGNAMLRAVAGTEVCVTVTLLDGLVLARSAYHHSMNYRSVVLVGTARKVEDLDEKRRALDAVVDHVLAGRSEVARPSTDGELRATLVVALPIREGSAKVRTGPPIDEPDDLDLPVWAGVVPIRTQADPPVQDPAQTLPLVAPRVPSRGATTSSVAAR